MTELEEYNMLCGSGYKPEELEKMKDNSYKRAIVVEQDDIFVVLGLMENPNLQRNAYDRAVNGEWWE